MTAAISEQYLARAATVLTAIVSGPGVYRNRTSLPNADEMPLVNLYDGDESLSETEEFGTAGIYQMNYELEAWVTGRNDADLGPNMSALKAQAVKALTTDAQLNGAIAIATRYDGMDRPIVDKTEGAAPVMGAVLRFQVRYQMSITDPTSQG